MIRRIGEWRNWDILFTRPKPGRFHLVITRVGGLEGQPCLRRLDLRRPCINEGLARLPRVESPGVPVPHGIPLEPPMTSSSADDGPDLPFLRRVHYPGPLRPWHPLQGGEGCNRGGLCPGFRD